MARNSDQSLKERTTSSSSRRPSPERANEMAPAVALLPAPADGANDRSTDINSTNVFWRCRDGPLVLKLSASSDEEASTEEQRSSGGAALAAFAAASRDSWLVARTAVHALSPSVLLPEVIARR
jgi:hypothetical protein